MSFRKLIEVALDQNGAESAETHDLRSGLDRVGGRRSNAGDVLVQVGGVQTRGRDKGVDVEAAALRADPGADVDMADGSRRNPWKDVLDLIVRQRRTLRA